MLKIKILPLYKKTPVVEKATKGSSGYDLRAYIDNPIVLKKNTVALVPCGFALEIPNNVEAQVRSRSGLAYKHGIMCLNSPGTIDADYRGEIKVILANIAGKQDFIIENNDRIAQMVFMNIQPVSLIFTNEISCTERNIGGFGSTGKK